jgi:hypothetical protein
MVDRSPAFMPVKGSRWRLPQAAFEYALEQSCRKAFTGRQPTTRELSRYATSLHLEDLALACACAEGHAAAWDHFVLEMRPALYRAADALDPSGGARDLADSLYADLYALTSAHAAVIAAAVSCGRGSLAAWLGAVLAQRRRSAPCVNRRSRCPTWPLGVDTAIQARGSSISAHGALARSPG